MPRRKNLFVLASIALALAFTPALLAARPAAARVELTGGRGEAVWFFRSCTPGQPGSVATWTVDLTPDVPNQRALNFQVENAYPGYQLECDLYFANSGKVPFSVKEITIQNPNSGDLALSVTVAPGERRKALQPCGSKPAWGTDPASLPRSCRSKIELTLTVGSQAQENSPLNFAVQVRLQEQTGQSNP